MLALSEVLTMPVVRKAGPRVVAGAAGLHRPVRWVHSSELADIGSLLREGDLLLSTGIAMPEGDDALLAMVRSMASSGAAGLVIELGRRWTTLPRALLEACEATDLPLVTLAREARFAAVAQVVGERIVDQQLAELREAQRVHETFTELSIAEASSGDILEAVQRLAGAAVVLESEQYHVLDYRSGPGDITALLADWSQHSRAIALDARTTWDEATGWLATRVGRKERGWGRLLVQVDARPTQRQVIMAERAAAALALHRLHDGHRDSMLRRTHQELVVGLLADPASPGLLQRCEASGLPTSGRRFVGVAFRPLAAGTTQTPPRGRLEEVTAVAVHAAHELRIPALVCHLAGDVQLLLSFPANNGTLRAVNSLAERIARRHAVVASAGRPVDRAAEIDRTLREARQVLDSVPAPESSRGRVHRLDDVGVRGLLAMLATDERLVSYVQRQLATLRGRDERDGLGLEAALRALLSHPGSKSEAAASLHLSRPVFYDRLARIQRLLGVDLDDAETRVSLHVALIADDVIETTR